MRAATDHRDVIIASAAHLFARKPYHEVLMDEVAEEAGVAKGTIYRHYATKEDLFSALALNYMQRIHDALQAVAATARPPLDRLREMIAVVAREIQERQEFFQVMQRNECNTPAEGRGVFMQRRDQIREHFVRVIGEGVRRGELACPFQLSFAADMIMGMIRGIIRFNNPQPTPEEMSVIVMQVITRGLGGPHLKGQPQ